MVGPPVAPGQGDRPDRIRGERSGDRLADGVEIGVASDGPFHGTSEHQDDGVSLA